MSIIFRSTITSVGPEVLELLEGGILILFAEGAPPELAEVSVLHRIVEQPSPDAPVPGAEFKIGDLSAILTGIGDHAWAKVRDIGHVVVNFNGEDVPERPGELCASEVNLAALAELLQAGREITIQN
ncbi:PTS cellobiose transporter subunit IIB [Acidisoma cellulosilytica]|uniref:PTS cellobiose transporter subunit IIB n=1 Tax=Acidisoma cellulosilyticum TaxID=2802395 RepID=A0A964E4E2_9PROT|nr:PTS glucitol/sorbitol transporter subunit IIA [Acidisoma cellulosilyticum]MCB8881384.1 PTS cellobiose transporter subunit IIB [Acidisoma cellulosilyticum]